MGRTGVCAVGFQGLKVAGGRQIREGGTSGCAQTQATGWSHISADLTVLPEATVGAEIAPLCGGVCRAGGGGEPLCLWLPGKEGAAGSRRGTKREAGNSASQDTSFHGPERGHC